MDRVNAIWKHPVYQEYYHRLEKLEEERIFCRHQMPHLLDVARIARIRSLEDGLELDTEVIYARRRGCALPVRQRDCVTGVKRKRIWR